MKTDTWIKDACTNQGYLVEILTPESIIFSKPMNLSEVSCFLSEKLSGNFGFSYGFIEFNDRMDDVIRPDEILKQTLAITPARMFRSKIKNLWEWGNNTKMIFCVGEPSRSKPIGNRLQIVISAREQIPMITPFLDRQITLEKGHPSISRGVSSRGYDITLGNKFIRYRDPSTMSKYWLDRDHTHQGMPYIDPKAIPAEILEEFTAQPGEVILMQPHDFLLGYATELFNIPANVATICLSKSTWARAGLIVNVTPFEPAWQGYATLELSNTTDMPIRLYPGEGIAQVLFFSDEEISDISYGERAGKYQGQQAVPVAPRMK